MGQFNITALAYLFAGSLFSLLAAIYTIQIRKKIVHWSLAFGCLGNAIWLCSIAFDFQWLTTAATSALIAELLRYVVWISALTATLQFLLNEPLPKTFRRLVYSGVVFAFAIIIIHIWSDLSPEETLFSLSCGGLILATIGLISAEQLYKNINQNLPL
mgnify:CR=1 FL=1